MVNYNQSNGKWVCDFCDAYAEEDKRKVNMHEITCKKRNGDDSVAPVAELESDVPEVKPKPARRERIPFGSPSQRLRAPHDDAFHYRYFNDGWDKEPGRVKRALDAGYERVEGYDPITVGKNDDNTPIKGVLMRIPKEFYEEDQKLKQREVDRVDAAIKAGTIEKQAGDNRYIPDGIKIWSSHTENR